MRFRFSAKIDFMISDYDLKLNELKSFKYISLTYICTKYAMTCKKFISIEQKKFDLSLLIL